MKHYIKYGLLSIGIFLTFSVSFAQDLDSRTSNLSFQEGEQVTYVISYSWFFIWLDVGEVCFNVTKDKKFDKELLHVKSTGWTYPFYDSFFKVRDLYESWVDPVTIQPNYFNRAINEGGFTKENEYKFDWQNNQVLTRIRRKNGPNKFDTLNVEKSTFDVVSAIYNARNFDYSNIPTNKIFPITALFDKEIYHIGYKYLGKEKKYVKGLGDFSCLKFNVDLVVGDIFSGDQKIFVWVTDDQNHIPVYIESPIKVGSVKARITEWKGLKYKGQLN